MIFLKKWGESMEESKNFEIDYFSGLGYKSMGLHRHDFSELLFVLEGKLNFLVGTEFLDPPQASLTVCPLGLCYT